MCIDNKQEFLLNLLHWKVTLHLVDWYSIQLNGDGQRRKVWLPTRQLGRDRVVRWEAETGIWLLKPPHPISRLSSLSSVCCSCEHKMIFVLHWRHHTRCTKSDDLSAQSPAERAERWENWEITSTKISTMSSVTACRTDDDFHQRNHCHWLKFSSRQCGSSQAISMTVMWGGGSQPVWDFDPWCNLWCNTTLGWNLFSPVNVNHRVPFTTTTTTTTTKTVIIAENLNQQTHLWCNSTLGQNLSSPSMSTTTIRSLSQQ